MDSHSNNVTAQAIDESAETEVTSDGESNENGEREISATEPGRTIFWDDENRIQRINDAKHTSLFAYDDQGQRLVKYVKNNSANTAKTTWYINQYYQLTNDVLVTKHIFNGSQRVLTKHSGGSIVFRSKPRNTRSSEGRPRNDIPGNGKADALKAKKGNPSAPGYIKKAEQGGANPNATENQNGNANGNSNGNGNQKDGDHPGQGIEHRSDRANEVAQNVYKNKNLQGEFNDPESPYYQGSQGTDENGQPIGNCSEINAGCTAGEEELAEYTGDEVVIIGSTKESLFYYHSDHLGSASVITDGEGVLREHLEYFAFGETWVQEGGSKKTPYKYTGKELDQETGLYYYGARYYDPRTSVWQSVDPILEKYLPSGDPDKDKNLPGMGGVFNSANLAGYTQSHNNPVKYSDPDGNEPIHFTKTLLDKEYNLVGYRLAELYPNIKDQAKIDSFPSHGELSKVKNGNEDLFLNDFMGGDNKEYLAKTQENSFSEMADIGAGASLVPLAQPLGAALSITGLAGQLYHSDDKIDVILGFLSSKLGGKFGKFIGKKADISANDIEKLEFFGGESASETYQKITE